MEKDKQDQFEAWIKQSLEHGEASPPDDIWDGLQRNLYPNHPPRKSWWSRILMAVLLMVLTPFLVYQFTKSNNQLPTSKLEQSPNNKSQIKKSNQVDNSDNNSNIVNSKNLNNANARRNLNIDLDSKDKKIDTPMASSKISDAKINQTIEQNSLPLAAISRANSDQDHTQLNIKSNVKAETKPVKLYDILKISNPTCSSISEYQSVANLNTLTSTRIHPIEKRVLLFPNQKGQLRTQIHKVKMAVEIEKGNIQSNLIDSLEGITPAADSNMQIENIDSSIAKKSRQKNSIEIIAGGGSSLFHQALFSSQLKSGAFTTTTSQDQGSQYFLQVQLPIQKKLQGYVGIAFNNKQSTLAPQLMVSPSDFLLYTQQKIMVPAANLSNANCDQFFIINNFMMAYKVQNYLLDFGLQSNLWQNKKLGFAIQYGVNTNAYSNIVVTQNNAISDARSKNETLSVLRGRATVNASYLINSKLRIGFMPQVNTQILRSKSSAFAKQRLELLLPLSVGYRW